MTKRDTVGVVFVLIGAGLVAVPAGAIIVGLVKAAFSYSTGMGLVVAAPLMGAVLLGTGVTLVRTT